MPIGVAPPLLDKKPQSPEKDPIIGASASALKKTVGACVSIVWS